MESARAARLRARQGAFLISVSGGDAVAAAHTAARVRLEGIDLDPAELAAARLARRRLGRAIRKVRARRAAEPDETRVILPRTSVTAQALSDLPPIAESHRDARVIAALAACLAIAIAFFVLRSGGSEESVGALGDPGVAVPEAAPAPLAAALAGRGRTSDLAVPIVAVVEPLPTALPTAAPAVVAVRVPVAPAPSGTGTGSGPAGGAAGAIGAPGEPKAVAPTLAGLIALIPPAVAEGYFRIAVHVVDAETGQALPDVCVIVGTADCAPGRPHTNLLGIWTTDIPKAVSATEWDIDLVMSGYQQAHEHVVTSGRDVWIEVRLRR